MKRNHLLKITGCAAEQFANFKKREQLPFVPTSGGLYDQDGKHADYSMIDAFQLRIFLDAYENKGISIEAAQYIAGNCLRHLWTASDRAEAVNCDKKHDDIWIFYAQGYLRRFEDNGEKWTPRSLGAGRLEEFESFVQANGARTEVQFITLINASMASDKVLGAAIQHAVLVTDDAPIKRIWQREYQTVNTEAEG